MKKGTLEKRIEDATNMCKGKIAKTLDECLNEVKDHVDKC